MLVGHLRALLRGAALFATTTPSLVSVSLAHLIQPLSPRAAVRWRRFVVRTWARVSCAIMGARVEVDGEPPEGSFFLVANHLSYVDIIVLHGFAPGRFLAKAEVAGWPLMGLAARAAGTVFVDRSRRRDLTRVIAEVERILANGEGVLVFPEGTSTKGDAVLPFRASIFEVAIRTGVPVSHASLGYATHEGAPPAHTTVCWWGDMAFLGHLYGLLKLRSFRATLAFGAESLRAETRKDLAALAHRAVEERFEPIVRGDDSYHREEERHTCAP